MTRTKKTALKFEDFPEFKPNLTPKEVLQMGSFGGTYFRPIESGVTGKRYGKVAWKELPEDWLKGLDIETQVASSDYDKSLNKYNVKCGASLEMWEEKGWIKSQDPYGWFQWYCRFYQGRRTKDDARQIDRWLKCAGPTGRWRLFLIGKILKSGKKYNDASVSPAVRQTLQHWGYYLTRADFEKGNIYDFVNFYLNF